jgi:hypothetical protein
MDEIYKLLPDIKLRFNIDHPTIEDCYMYGYECAQVEIEESENPFKPGTRESDQWLEGWWAGFYEEKPLFASTKVLKTIKKPLQAANDLDYYEKSDSFFTKLIEITSAIAVSSFLCYQIIDLVA